MKAYDRGTPVDIAGNKRATQTFSISRQGGMAIITLETGTVVEFDERRLDEMIKQMGLVSG